MTKREAVNELLLALNEMPLPDDIAIDEIQISDTCDKFLDISTKKILSYGWNFNSYTTDLVPNSDGYILIPSSFLQVDATDKLSNIVVRDYRLFDKDELSYVFDSSVECDIIDEVPFDDIPFAVVNFIIQTSIIQAYTSIIGSSDELKLFQQSLIEARIEALRYEANTLDGNLINTAKVRS